MTKAQMIRWTLGAKCLASILLGLLALPALSEESVTLDEINKRQVDCALDFEATVFDCTPEPKDPIPPPLPINNQLSHSFISVQLFS